MNDERARNRLLIGEVSRLLGTTPKAVRHYEKLGLLAEPRRTPSGYRLYTADDLLRLHRIKTLQALGLSLERIKDVLGENSSGAELETVLRALLSEVEGRISALENRRARLQEILAGDADRQKAGDSYMLELAREHLGDLWDEVDPRVRQPAEEFWATLDDFQWPEGYRRFQERFVRYLADHPEEFERLLALEKRFAALAEAPEDSPEVASLAREYAAHFERHPLLEELAAGIGGPEAVEQTLSGVMLGSLAPAQKRCMELLLERMDKGGVE